MLLGKQSVVVIVPTFEEVENIPFLVDRVSSVRDKTGLDINLLLMDDNSRDGSEEFVGTLHLPWIRMLIRRTDRGLSQAVLDGIRRSTEDILVVMDADLSHPPEKIPELLSALEQGADFVVGSRFIEQGSTDDDWGLFRWLNSRVASTLALPLTRLKDPMSGFFAIRRSTFLKGKDFNPVGYKIALELLVKCRCVKAVEIPIHFTDRKYGTSKLSLKEQFKYLQHLRRLYKYKYGNWAEVVQFLIVGASGLVVNVVFLTAFLAVETPETIAVASAILVSMTSNFALNRRFTFSHARGRRILKQYVGYILTSTLSAIINYFVTILVWDSFDYKQIAAVVGVLAGTVFNFVGSRYLVFRKKYIAPDPAPWNVPVQTVESADLSRGKSSKNG
jgi:dolichol-phosphate mannosyltransferase